MFYGLWYLQRGGREWNTSHRLRYHAYFFLRGVTLKVALPVPYLDAVLAKATVEVDWEAATVVKTYDQDGEYVRDEEGAEALDGRNFLKCLEITDAGVVMPILVHSCSQLCL